MNEISSMVVRSVLRLATGAGLDPEPLVAGLSFDQRSLQRLRRVGWEDACAMVERFAATLGGVEQLQELSAAGYHDSLPAEARTLFRTLVSPKMLYRFIFTVVNPPSFPNIDFEYRELPDDRIWIAGRIRLYSRGCLAFHHGNLGAIRGVPAHLGLPFAEVEVEELTARNLAVMVRPPASQTLIARAQRKSLASVRDAALRLVGVFAHDARDRGDSLATLLEARPRSGDPEVLARVQEAERALALTRRQTEVLALLVRGLSNKEIGTTLGCAENTVELHVTQLLRKAGADGRVQLVARFWTDELKAPAADPTQRVRVPRSRSS